MARQALALAGLVLGMATAAEATLCQGTPQPTTMDICQTGWICTGDGWIERYAAAGTACNDNDACTSSDVCNGGNVCSGTLTSPPGVPGPMSGPASTNFTGSYAVSWGASTTCYPSRYELFENGALVYSGAGLSFNVSGKHDGTYTYQVRACNSAACSALNAPFNVTVLFPPSVPTLPTVHAKASCDPPSLADASPNYTVCWAPTSSTVDHYDLAESNDNQAWTTTSTTAASQSYTAKAYGSYYYKVRACNAAGCSAYTASSPSNVVEVITSLSAVQDTPVVAPTQPIPAQEWVGALPGTASVEGGAATYRIPIAIPPGRSGMQPEVMLSYSSRNGNGVAGVGWALAAGGSIYRCPQTLAQDGQNRVVHHDADDRLCMDGQRLTTGVSPYGSTGEYRTEIESYARVTLAGAADTSWTSYFVVERKDGRVDRYEPSPSSGAVPDSWHLVAEFDRRGNCMSYTYADSGNHSWVEPLLWDIIYTGATSGTGVTTWQCGIDATARHVRFEYVPRLDVRTTYEFGAPSSMSVLLSAVTTWVGETAVRRYELSYSESAVTKRSLLTSARVCAQGVCLPDTTFAYQQDTPKFTTDDVYLNVQRLGADWRAALAADYDGDGKRDRVYFQDTTAGMTRTLELSGCRQSPSSFDPTRRFLPIDMPITFNQLYGTADFNYDGRTDAIETLGGDLAFADVSCGPSSAAWNDTPTSLPWAPNTSVMIPASIDFDGDGRIDLDYVAASDNQEHILFHESTDRTQWTAANTIALPAGPAGTSRSLQDVNGDGLTDLLYSPLTGGTNTSANFYLGAPSAMFSGTFSLTQLNGPASVTGSAGGVWIDVNGDGLPDIYQQGQVWLNQGGTIPTAAGQNVPLFRGPLPVSIPAFARNRVQYSFTMDIDNDGKQELMVPSYRSSVSTYCGGDPTQVYGPDSAPAWFCGDEFDTAPQQYWSYDRSIFVWSAYRFEEHNDGTYALVEVPQQAPLEAPINYPLGTGDDDGNGTDDVFFREIDSANNNAYDASVWLGPRISHNHAGAPDLLTQVINGLGSKASWQHQPLSSADPNPAVKDVVGCDKTDGRPFYTVNLDATRSDGYLFFTSSMWVVSAFDADSGQGTTTNRTCYRYEDAMLNGQGRGFQGFKTIVAEQQSPAATGELPMTGLCGGGNCSADNLRTTTRFFQEFPLTSRLNTVTVSTLDGRLVSDSTYSWDAQYSSFVTAGSPRVVDVSAVGRIEKKYEPGPPDQLSSVTALVAQFDATSGEPTAQCTISSGASPQPSQDVIATETRILTDDPSIWLLGQVASRTMVNDFFSGTLPSGACQISAPTTLVPSACASAPPACPSSPAQAPRTRTAFDYWYGDSAPAGSQRQLQSEIVIKPGTAPSPPPAAVPDADVESKFEYTYDPHGNISTKHTYARDAAMTSANPPASTGLADVGITSYGSSTDGYFVTSESNPLNHTATTSFDPATGEVIYHLPIQGGASTTMTYDVLGRGLLSSITDGTQPIQTRITACDSGDCSVPPPSVRLPCSSGNCILRRQSFQAGAPIRTDYLDRLGRVIATGVEGFDGLEVITKVDYNVRGAKIAEHQPMSTGLAPGKWNGAQASQFLTQYSGIDPLGRATTKTVVRSSPPALFAPGRGNANLVTTYANAVVAQGVRTAITVSTPTTASGQITMSRTYDPRGKLVETVQDVSAPTSHSITTSYSYDPAGNLAAITDSGNNQLKAFYDDLGRKLEVDDPDRGKWFYTWDGLGRVRTQKDARGITLAYQYDAIGRMEERFMQASSTSPWLLEANWQYDLNNKAGTLGAMYGVPDNTAGVALDLTQPAAMFHRDYKYDALLRPWSVSTHVPAGSAPGVTTWTAQDLTIEYGYDYNYGRMKAMSSPGGNQEFVRFDYDVRGNPVGETPLGADLNPPAGALPYRQVVSMSVRGQVTEQLFGNNVDETMTYDESTGLATSMDSDGLHEPSAACPGVSTPMVRHLTYQYDHFLNLATQQRNAYQRDANGALVFSNCAPIQVTANETYDYDELQRLTRTSRTWTNVTPDALAAAPTQYDYSDLGNITGKSDYAATYTYPPSGANTYVAPGPHAVTSLSNGMTFAYDANGNLTSSTGVDARGVIFDNLDRPITITKGSVKTIFRYAPDGERFLQATSTGGTSPYPKTIYYVDKLFEREIWNGSTEERVYVGTSTVIHRLNASRDVRYLSLDRLGSVEAVTTSSAAEYVADQHSFDAFGRPRKGDFTTGLDRLHSSDYNVTTEHGFTGHEHLDETYLIHMNGRVYDYQLGRFLSVDPIVSNPLNSQSINAYSYLTNNPLSGVDPTGYECNDYSFSRCDTIYVNDGVGPRLRDKVAQFLKQWNGSSSTPKTGTASGANSPTATANAEPTENDLERWLRNDSPWLLGQFRRAWGEYTMTVGEKWARSLGGPSQITGDQHIMLALLTVRPLPVRWMQSAAGAATMFLDWATGSGPDVRTFRDGSVEVEEMQKSYQVGVARDLFYRKNAEMDRGPTNAEALTNFPAKFGLMGLLRAGLSPTQQFVGSYDVDIIPRDDATMTFYLRNTTSMRSLLYGKGPDWSRDTFRFFGNMEQYYLWTEPIDPSRLRLHSLSQ